MLLIILKSSACLAVFMLFYKLLLEQTSAHKFKRFYLLGILFISFVIPFITFTNYIEAPLISNALVSRMEFEASTISNPIETSTSSTNYFPILIWLIYGIGVVLFLFRFIINLSKLTIKIKRCPQHKLNKTQLVLTNEKLPPHTFFNYIFLNKDDFDTAKIDNTVLLHEQTHALQKHTIDILFIEMIQIILWFNPLLILLKKHVKLNHEFLSDQSVLNTGIKRSHYQNTLLSFSSNMSYSILVNPINYSSLKKRFKIMTTKTSQSSILLRIFVLFPILALLIYGFSKNETVLKQTAENETESIVTSIKEGNGAGETMMHEYKLNMKLFEEEKLVFSGLRLSRMFAIYSLMTFEQRKSVKSRFSKRISAYNSKFPPHHPSQKEFESWKKSDEYVFYIDGRLIHTSELNSYTHKDIYSYSNKLGISGHPDIGSYDSKIFMLSTKEGFEKIIQNSKAMSYNKLLLKYKKGISTYENIDLSHIPELRILKLQLDNIFKNLTPEEIERFNILKAPDLQDNSAKNKVTVENNQQVIEYNTLAKKYNNQNAFGHHYFKNNELKKLYSLYASFSKEVKETIEPFPYFPNQTLENNYIKQNKKTKKKVDIKSNETANKKHEIKVFVNKNKQIFVETEKVDFNSLSHKIIELKNQLMATKYANKVDSFKIKYNLFVAVKIEGHVTEQYLIDIKTEIEKSNLITSSIITDSVSPNKMKTSGASSNNNFKKINILSNKDTIYNYHQTTKITIDTIKNKS